MPFQPASLGHEGRPPWGTARTREIIGPDDRARVPNTREWPYRSICYLFTTFEDDSTLHGSGVLIGDFAVATAGHCVVNKRGSRARSIRIIPGAYVDPTRGLVAPFETGSGDGYADVGFDACRFRPEWGSEYQAKESRFDYAVVALPPDKPFGERAGYMALHPLGPDMDSWLGEQMLQSAGYPGDKPAGSQWWGSGGLARYDADRLYYVIDTAGGQSGSPIYIFYTTDGGPVTLLAGIHTYGSGDTTGVSDQNSAVRINPAVFAALMGWR